MEWRILIVLFRTALSMTISRPGKICTTIWSIGIKPSLTSLFARFVATSTYQKEHQKGTRDIIMGHPIQYIYSAIRVSVSLISNIIITFRRILKNKSTEEYSGVPSTMTLLICLLSVRIRFQKRILNNKAVEDFSGVLYTMTLVFCLLSAWMVGLAPEESQFLARQYDEKIEPINADIRNFISHSHEVHECFDVMGWQENLPMGINAYGFEKPSAIQQRGIVPSCRGNDLIQQAQPGTSDREDQPSGVHVVVCTPVHVFDLLQTQSLLPTEMQMFVLDDADRTLSRGFKDQIYDEIQLLPSKVQVEVFSAKKPSDALEIPRKFLNKPVGVLLKCDEERMKQFIVNVEKEEWNLATQCESYETLAMCTMNIMMREVLSGSSAVLVRTHPMTRGVDMQQQLTKVEDLKIHCKYAMWDCSARFAATLASKGEADSRSVFVSNGHS